MHCHTALTHLGMSKVPWNIVEKLLTDCPKLELLVLLWPYAASFVAFRCMKHLPFRDVRLVAALYRDYLDDWENGARGGSNLWSVEDAFVASDLPGSGSGPSPAQARGFQAQPGFQLGLLGSGLRFAQAPRGLGPGFSNNYFATHVLISVNTEAGII
ncbi:hypothetical protein B0H11DRAFT_2229676 [Mycena galericulata]|nr:hypothetical protein B0H11DRAFT_2229676 [Mycena galericulata]